MVCSDHEWEPQDVAIFDEQQRQKKLGAMEKGKRKVLVSLLADLVALCSFPVTVLFLWAIATHSYLFILGSFILMVKTAWPN